MSFAAGPLLVRVDLNRLGRRLRGKPSNGWGIWTRCPDFVPDSLSFGDVVLAVTEDEDIYPATFEDEMGGWWYLTLHPQHAWFRPAGSGNYSWPPSTGEGTPK